MTRIQYFKWSFAKWQQTTRKIDFSKDNTAERDAPRDQLNTVCLVSSISRPVLLIGGQLVGLFLSLVPRNKLLTPVASYSTQCLFLTKQIQHPSVHAAPRQESKSKTRRSKPIDSNIWGVIPFPRTSTQAVLLTSNARGENRADEFYTCFHFQGPRTFRLVDGAPFLVPSHTPQPLLEGIQGILSLSVMRKSELHGTCTGVLFVLGLI